MLLPNQPLFFDPGSEFSVTEGRLPHWDQPGVAAFITFRTWDSIPRPVLDKLTADRDAWLLARGIDPSREKWEAELARLSLDDQHAFRRHRAACWNDALDDCHGSCPFRDAANAELVANSLRHFDGQRYVMFDFVIMPNHVHLLASFLQEGAMMAQCESWKHFTAVRLNKALGRTGRFWESESFDHLVRSDDQFEYYRGYITANPSEAKLRPGTWLHYSRGLESGPLAPRAAAIASE